MRLFSVGVRMRTYFSFGLEDKDTPVSRHNGTRKIKQKGRQLARIWAARALSRGSPKALASNGEHRK
jgi:hypothetical protein